MPLVIIVIAKETRPQGKLVMRQKNWNMVVSPLFGCPSPLSPLNLSSISQMVSCSSLILSMGVPKMYLKLTDKKMTNFYIFCNEIQGMSPFYVLWLKLKQCTPPPPTLVSLSSYTNAHHFHKNDLSNPLRYWSVTYVVQIENKYGQHHRYCGYHQSE